nr:RHS repeat-associated core domain-containing protein [Saccharibacillus sp. WB 17]
MDAGGVQTDVNGLYQMRARYYNPAIKRFVNRDVLSGSIGDGLTLNRYAYVNGNPVSYIDPFGLSADGATWWETGLSFAADATPFVGTLKGIQEVFSGVDLITGQQSQGFRFFASAARSLFPRWNRAPHWSKIIREAVRRSPAVWQSYRRRAT